MFGLVELCRVAPSTNQPKTGRYVELSRIQVRCSNLSHRQYIYR